MKNTLKIIAGVLVLTLCLISLKVIIDDKKEKEDTDIGIKKVELSYLVDDFVGYYENIELTNSEKEELIKIFTSLDYEHEKIDVDLAIIPKYRLIFDDKVLYFSDGDEEYATFVQNNREEIIETKSLKAKIKSYMEVKNVENVFLFQRDDLSTTDFVKLELSDEDKKLLEERFSYSELTEPVNLMIAGKYVLVVNNDSLAFDDILSNYAMNGNEMVIKNSSLNEILDKNIYDESDIKDGYDECCSCCPDLKPGETCISMCCPCS